MKSKDALRILKISRITLMNYVKTGKITATKLANGYYDYHDESVLKFVKKDYRYNVIYGRVSTYKQKNDLENQIKGIRTFCDAKNYTYDFIYKDIASGLDFDRKNFSILLDSVFNYKIKTVFISYKDRMTRLSFKTISEIFKKFGTEIYVINDNRDKDNEKELFEELINIIHHFSTTIYSKRRKQKLNLIEDDIKLYKNL